jgi:hypothetical protein
MIRLRDVLAVGVGIYLWRLAWDDPSESLAATAHLSFYVGREEAHPDDSASSKTTHLVPVLLDVDGDGTAESMVTAVYDSKEESWKLRLLDLKPAANTDKTHMAPFRPAILYESPAIVLPGVAMSDIQPISMTTGQVLLTQQTKPPSAPRAASTDATQYNGHAVTDNNRHYFCGEDWHDASSKCGTPCPGGQSSECETSERCFADTPCDIATRLKASTKKAASSLMSIDDLYVTPAGGLPSIFTLWSNGSVTMHSLTGDAAPADDPKRKLRKPRLEIRAMWQSDIMTEDRKAYAWSDLHLSYLDAIDAGNLDGMLLVQAAVDYFAVASSNPEEMHTVTFLTALDGRTGKTLWEADAFQSADEEQDKDVPLPVVPGTSSTARRRSGIPFDLDESGSALVTNCMHNYRHSMLTSGALPHLFWGEEDAVVQALHFETQPLAKAHAKAKNSPPHNGHNHHHKKRHTRHGKPNVVVSKTHRGLQIRSLRNGRSLCHVSLWPETLYADLNHDGVLDATFVMTGQHRLPAEHETANLTEDEKWTYQLMLRLVEDEEARVQSRRERKYHHVCHSMTLSGIPAREELFSYPLCESDHEHREDLPEADPGPPLAVEAMRGQGYDLILAVNNGLVHRVRSNGRRQWELHGREHEDFPTWEEDGSFTLMDRINAKKVIPSTRPIIMTGENSLALIGPRSGKLLSTAAFPQPVVQRPILVDFNGDGTTDVIVATADAYWGYHVSVRTGSSIFFRLTVGLLLIGIMLALLRNRFGPHPGKRATDA